jgi:hypothetical protein
MTCTLFIDKMERFIPLLILYLCFPSQVHVFPIGPDCAVVKVTAGSRRLASTAFGSL